MCVLLDGKSFSWKEIQIKKQTASNTQTTGQKSIIYAKKNSFPSCKMEAKWSPCLMIPHRCDQKIQSFQNTSCISHDSIIRSFSKVLRYKILRNMLHPSRYNKYKLICNTSWIWQTEHGTDFKLVSIRQNVLCGNYLWETKIKYVQF